MKDYQLRVIAERDELESKVTKLGAFIESKNPGSPFQSVDADEQSRLRRQLIVMREYLNILNERINNFKE